MPRGGSGSPAFEAAAAWPNCSIISFACSGPTRCNWSAAPARRISISAPSIRGDAVVVIGFAPYSTASVLSARAAHDSGATLIAIADTMAAPMAEGAEHLLLFEAASSPGFFPSLTGAIAIAQSLAAVTFALGGAAAKRRLEETEASPRARCRNMLPRKVDRHGRSSRAACCIEACVKRPPKAVGGEGVWLIAEDGRRILDALRRRRRLLSRPPASARDRGDVQAGVEARLCPYRLSSRRSRRRRWPTVSSAMSRAGSPTPISSAADRKRSKPASSWRGNISSRAAAAAPALHRAPPELSRQYAGRAGRRRQRLAPRALRAAAVAGLQPCDAGLRLS